MAGRLTYEPVAPDAEASVQTDGNLQTWTWAVNVSRFAYPMFVGGLDIAMIANLAPLGTQGDYQGPYVCPAQLKDNTGKQLLPSVTGSSVAPIVPYRWRGTIKCHDDLDNDGAGANRIFVGNLRFDPPIKFDPGAGVVLQVRRGFAFNSTKGRVRLLVVI